MSKFDKLGPEKNDNRFAEFIKSIDRGECENVRKLFEKEFISKRWLGLTALHSACQHNTNDHIVKYLLSEGADIENESDIGWRPIHYSAHSGHISVLTPLIEQGCCLDCVTSNGDTPFDLASKHNREGCARLLQTSTDNRKNGMESLEKNSLSKIVDTETGRTLLDQLLSYNDPCILNQIRSKLVDKLDIEDWISLKTQGVNPESYRLLHECILWRSIHQKYDDGVYTLCTAEIVNSNSLFMGPSPLETAVEFDTLFYVKHILEKLVQEDETWKRAAKIAEDKKLSNISLLISERIDYLNAKRAIKFSSLHTAVLENDPGMADYIIKKTVDPDEVNKIFGTALSMAYSLNQMKCVQILQNNNANVNIVDRLGQSALHVAINNGIEHDYEYLVNNMKNLEAKDYMNQTVLELAVMNDCSNACELLLKKGAKCDNYIDSTTFLDRDTLTKNAPYRPITKKETIHSLCIKINKTIYPCLLDTINKHTIKYTDGEENTLLHLCAIFLMPRLCSEMILKSAKVDSLNENGGTPLMELLKYNYDNTRMWIEGDLIETVNILINGGASLNIKDHNDLSIIDRATEFHNEKLLLALIQKKERLECVKELQLSTWLCDKYFTVIKEVIPLLNKSLLIEWITKDRINIILQEADISLAKIMYDHASNDVKTTILETILYKAASIGDKTYFECMVNDEISAESSLECGESLMICLIRDKKEDFIKLLLLSRNASLFIEKRSTEKKLPLHMCIESGYWDVLHQLIENTKCVDEEDIDGNTPLSLLLRKFSEVKSDALYNWHTFVYKLLSKSADIYKRNKQDRTAISYCTTSHMQSKIESYFRRHQYSKNKSPTGPQKEDSTAAIATEFVKTYRTEEMDTALIEKMRSISKDELETKYSTNEKEEILRELKEIMNIFDREYKDKIFTKIKSNERLTSVEHSKMTCFTLSVAFLAKMNDIVASKWIIARLTEYLLCLSERTPFSRPSLTISQIFLYGLCNISRNDVLDFDDSLAPTLLKFFKSSTNERIKLLSAYLWIFFYNRDKTTMIKDEHPDVLRYLTGEFEKMKHDQVDKYLGFVCGEREWKEVNNAHLKVKKTTSTESTIQSGAEPLIICNICLTEPTNCTLNCGHTFCVTCAEKILDCGLCRTRITARIKMFL